MTTAEATARYIAVCNALERCKWNPPPAQAFVLLAALDIWIWDPQ